MSLFYISFATPTEFLGATVVEAEDDQSALTKVTTAGVNPGGEALVIQIPFGLPADHMVQQRSYTGRLVTKDELIGHGAKRSGDLGPDMQNALKENATFVCAEGNDMGAA